MVRSVVKKTVSYSHQVVGDLQNIDAMGMADRKTVNRGAFGAFFVGDAYTIKTVFCKVCVVTVLVIRHPAQLCAKRAQVRIYRKPVFSQRMRQRTYNAVSAFLL